MMSYECLKHRQDHLLLQKFPLNTDRFSCRLQNIVDDSVRKKWLILMQLPLPVIRFLTFRKVLWSTQDLRSKPKCSHVLFVHEILRLLTVLIRFLGSKLMWKCSLIISMNVKRKSTTVHFFLTRNLNSHFKFVRKAGSVGFQQNVTW